MKIGCKTRNWSVEDAVIRVDCGRSHIDCNGIGYRENRHIDSGATTDIANAGTIRCEWEICNSLNRSDIPFKCRGSRRHIGKAEQSTEYSECMSTHLVDFNGQYSNL